jgi:hypothetical protein
MVTKLYAIMLSLKQLREGFIHADDAKIAWILPVSTPALRTNTTTPFIPNPEDPNTYFIVFYERPDQSG